MQNKVILSPLLDVVLMDGGKYPADGLLTFSDDRKTIAFDFSEWKPSSTNRCTRYTYKNIRIPDFIHGEPVQAKQLIFILPEPVTLDIEVWRGRMQDPDDIEVIGQETLRASIYVDTITVPKGIQKVCGSAVSCRTVLVNHCTQAQDGRIPYQEEFPAHPRPQTSFQKYQDDLKRHGPANEEFAKCLKCGSIVRRQDTRCGWCGAHLG